MSLKSMFRRWRAKPKFAAFLCGYWITDNGLYDKDWQKMSYAKFEVTVTSQPTGGFDFAMRAENMKVQHGCQS